jgi:hypothetical protein
LWEECYSKPISWLEGALSTSTVSIDRLAHFRNLILALVDEGATFYQLLLRNRPDYAFLVYSAILLEKREKFVPFHKLPGQLNYNNPCRRSFALLQEAITMDPFKGFGYGVLAQWARDDGDLLLAIYWALIGANVPEGESEKCLQFLKQLAKDFAVSPSQRADADSFEIGSQVIQMALHTFLSQLTGKSHLKYLDQLSHSKLSAAPTADPKILKYSCDVLWMILGMEKGLFASTTDICPVRTCLLAKLFQINCKFLASDPHVKQSFIAFATNPNYSRLFTGNNYEIIRKINPFAFDSLNSLLQEIARTCTIRNSLPSVDANNESSSDELYFDDSLEEVVQKSQKTAPPAYTDYLMLESFQYDRNDEECNDDDLIEFFIRSNLLIRRSGDSSLVLTAQQDKWKKSLHSMKLMTSHFLRTQLEMAESMELQDRLAWTVPDYPSLLRDLEKIQAAVLDRKVRIIISFAILNSLDLDKSNRPESRNAIRFLAERLEAKDLSIRFQPAPNNSKSSHFQCVKQLLIDNPDDSFKLIFAQQSINPHISKLAKQQNVTIFNEFALQQ